jgi:hypothetical protein
MLRGHSGRGPERIVSQAGYVKIYRALMDKGYYGDSEYVHLWVHLLMKATYCKREYLFNGKIEHLQPGQFITGRNSISKETGIHRSKVERILNCFESEHQIEQQKTNKFRIITITNWDEYQTLEQQDEQQMSIQRASSEHPVSTNKKDKKDKKDKKEEIPLGEPFIFMPLVDNSEHPIYPNMIQEWKNLYPKVDVEQALRDIRGWNLANLTRRKTKGGILKHINSWLAKEQNHGGSNGRGTGGTVKAPEKAGRAQSDGAEYPTDYEFS